MIIMIGLPASGKSTRAKELLEQGNTVRINKDLIREMLHCNKFNRLNEEKTRGVARALASQFLKSGTSVIIDDTNLNPGTLQSWVDLAKECDAKIQYERIDTPVEVCVERDLVREKKVGEHVIKKMALQHLGYLSGENVIISDLDGTIADCSHRLKYAKGDTKDWNRFFAGISEDTPRKEVMEDIVKMAVTSQQKNGKFPKIILVSARPEDYRESTVAWLEKHFPYKYETLIMREANDKRDDTEVKSEIHKKYLSKLNILAVFDDRPKVIRMWRGLGLNVVDVGSGVEF